MYYFVYHIHTIALYWQEKSTLLMNENKRIDNPWIEIIKCVGALEMKTCFESPQNTNNGPNFSIYTILSYWIGRYRQKKSFRYTAKIGLWQIFQLLIFILSRGKCYYQSHWIRNVRFFFPYFGFLSFLGKFGRHCLKVIRILRIFSDKRPWINNGEGFAVHSSTWPSGAKGEWRASSWLAISNTREKISYFFTCFYGSFQGWKSFYNTAVYFQTLQGVKYSIET